jgi:hypothetical protein
MSTPVIISVTGCSTWIRAFTSRKKNSPSGVRMHSTVPAPRKPRASMERTAA